MLKACDLRRASRAERGAQMLALARERFGIEDFRPGQEAAIDRALLGESTLAIMPTGAGKSLCYQLPALVLPGVTLVVSPLIALMKDQYDKLDHLGIEVVRLDSTLTQREEADALRRLSSGRSRVAYITPERLGDSRFRALLGRCQVDLFVVDEAHCISQWGHDFRPAYLGLGEAVRALGKPPVLALTATAPPRVKDDIVSQLDLGEARVLDIGLSRPNLAYRVVRARSERIKQQQLLRLLRRGDTGIVYAATVKAVDALYDFLRDEGIDVGRYHGRMRAREREQIQESFMHRGTPRVMVATNAFGLGVDKQDIRFVIHYHFPGSLESYYQEAGRAGRDGAPATCVLLYQPEDKRIQSFFLGGRYPTAEQTHSVAAALIDLYKVKPAPQQVKDIAERADTPVKKTRVVLSLLSETRFADENVDGFVPRAEEPPSLDELEDAGERYQQKRDQDSARLQAMLRYSESHLCRNRLLLSYFGYGDDAPPCGTCDNCTSAERAKKSRSAERAAKQLARERAAERAARAGESEVERTELVANAVARQRSRVARSRALKVEKNRGRAPGEIGKGDVVRHKTWGEGEVVQIQADTVCAFFPGVGEKRLKVAYLEKIG